MKKTVLRPCFYRFYQRLKSTYGDKQFTLNEAHRAFPNCSSNSISAYIGKLSRSGLLGSVYLTVKAEDGSRKKYFIKQDIEAEQGELGQVESETEFITNVPVPSCRTTVKIPGRFYKAWSYLKEKYGDQEFCQSVERIEGRYSRDFTNAYLLFLFKTGLLWKKIVVKLGTPHHYFKLVDCYDVEIQDRRDSQKERTLNFIELAREELQDSPFFTKDDLLAVFDENKNTVSIFLNNTKNLVERFSFESDGKKVDVYTFDKTKTIEEAQEYYENFESAKTNAMSIEPKVQLQGTFYQRYLDIRRRKIVEFGTRPLHEHDEFFRDFKFSDESIEETYRKLEETL